MTRFVIIIVLLYRSLVVCTVPTSTESTNGSDMVLVCRTLYFELGCVFSHLGPSNWRLWFHCPQVLLKSVALAMPVINLSPGYSFLFVNLVPIVDLGYV